MIKVQRGNVGAASQAAGMVRVKAWGQSKVCSQVKAREGAQGWRQVREQGQHAEGSKLISGQGELLEGPQAGAVRL